MNIPDPTSTYEKRCLGAATITDTKMGISSDPVNDGGLYKKMIFTIIRFRERCLPGSNPSLAERSENAIFEDKDQVCAYFQ